MNERFEHWLCNADEFSAHLRTAIEDGNVDSALKDVVELTSYASRQLSLVRQRLSKAMRHRFGSKSESVQHSQMLLDLIGALLQDPWSAAALPSGMDGRFCTGPASGDRRTCIVEPDSDSDSARCAEKCTVTATFDLCFNGRKWLRFAARCDGRRSTPRPRAKGQRKPPDLSSLPKVVHTHMQDDPGDTEFIRFEETQSIELQPAIAYVLVTRREVRAQRSGGRPRSFRWPWPLRAVPRLLARPVDDGPSHHFACGLRLPDLPGTAKVQNVGLETLRVHGS